MECADRKVLTGGSHELGVVLLSLETYEGGESVLAELLIEIESGR